MEAFPDIFQRRSRGLKDLRIEDVEVNTECSSRLVNHVGELQEQLKSFREEMRKKDEMIQKLASLDVKYPLPLHDPTIIATGVGTASVRSEIAALQVKVDMMTTKLRDKDIEVAGKEEQIAVQKREIELLKEDNARQAELVATLKDQISELEKGQTTFDALKYRNEFAVTSLQEQYKIVQERNAELEARLKAHLDDRERADQMRGSMEKRYIEFVGRISHLLMLPDARDIEGMMMKLTEIINEHAVLKGRIVTLSETVNANELEMKASRETISRLVAEVGRDQRDRGGLDLKTELEKSQEERANLERQVELLEAQLEATKKAMRAAKDELSDRDALVAKLECEKREHIFSSESNEKQFQVFLDSIAVLLGSAYSHVPANEEAVREKIKLLVREVKEQSSAVENLESRLKNITRQFETQYENSKEADMKYRRAEGDYIDLKERIRVLESEIAAGDVLRDGLRADKEKFFKYMQKLAEIMKMDHINADLGFDMVGEGLLARAEQLAKLECDAVADRTSAVHSLQRKCRSQKEQLESKDLHLDLLRKKVGQLEERLGGRVDLERDYEREEVRVKKLQRLLEKSNMALEEARSEIVTLKAQLMECSNLKITALEQDKELQGLEKTLEKLERVRQKQAQKISLLKGEVGDREKEFDDKRSVAEGAVQSLSSELRTTKHALEEARRREKALLEFRAVVGRMLGLNLDSLSIPDYEIINRLERLVTAQQSNVFTSFAAEETLADMEEGFRAGYTDAHRLMGGRRSPQRSPTRRPLHKSRDPRARSPSPHRRDHRAY